MLHVEIDDISVMELEWAQVQISMAFRKLEPRGLGRLLQLVTEPLYDYMRTIVHVITGRLRASLYPGLDEENALAWIGTNLSYAVEESERPGAKTRGTPPYGGHDFLLRTIVEEGHNAADIYLNRLIDVVEADWTKHTLARTRRS